MAPWDISYPRALVVTLSLAVGVTILVGGLTSATAFGAYNTAWDGTTDLRSVAESGGDLRIVRNTSTYGSVDASASVAFVLSPDSPYSSQEAARVERFLDRGGTLVVAEDVGSHSNALLRAVGADARFTRARLRDERNYHNAPALPVANNVSEHPFTAGVDRVTLNYGTTVDPNGARALVNSSSYGYLDRNGNDALDDSETLGTYPVVTVESVGDGRIVAVSDPSVFVNAMLEREGNRQFATNLVDGHRVRLYDVSHLAGLPPLVSARFILRETPVLQVGLGLAVVVALSYATLGSRVRAWLRMRGGRASHADPAPPPDDTTLRAWVREQRPEWDPDRVRRISEEIIRQKQNHRSDE